MRNYRVFLFLLVGMMYVSCSEQGGVKVEENEIDREEVELEEVVEEATTKGSEENTALSWKSYHNERYDFCVGYPSNFLREKGESANRDGNTFANANGSSEMRASAMYNALEQTIDESYQMATENDRYYEDERIITYKQQKGNWFVVSGKYYESIFYVRTVLIGDTFYTLYFEYHSSEEAKFKEIIKVTSRDFPKC